MTQGRDVFEGAFDEVDPADFTDAPRLAAKLANLDRTFVHNLFDLDEFVDRCVRRTEESFTSNSRQPTPTAVLACGLQDVCVPIRDGESMIAFLDRLHEEVVSRQATAAFLVKTADHGWSPENRDDLAGAAPPALYFYSESRAGAVIHGFWRVTGRGMAAHLTECYKVRSAEPNRIMHRIIAGGE